MGCVRKLCGSCVDTQWETTEELRTFDRGQGGALVGLIKRQPPMAEDSNHDQVLDSYYHDSTKPYVKALVPIPSKLGTIARTFGPCIPSAGLVFFYPLHR